MHDLEERVSRTNTHVVRGVKVRRREEVNRLNTYNSTSSASLNETLLPVANKARPGMTF